MIDNELHKEVIASRLKSLAYHRGLSIADSQVDIIACRGRGLNLLTLRPTIEQIAKRPELYRLIVLDAWYRFIPPGMDENSNSDMTTLFNVLDEYAEMTGAAILAVHHTSKGIQGSKSITDVGSGAGAQSRAVDAHLVIREHEEEGAFVVDAACRSFPPLAPFCMRRNFPLWERAEDLDPLQIKRERPARGSGKAPEKPIEQWTAERFAAEFIADTPRDTATVKAFATESGLSTRQVAMFLELVKSEGHAYFREQQGRRPAMYCRQPAFKLSELS